MDQILGTEFLQGQGLGNRLFCYITARSLAIDSGRTFATAGQQWLRADFLDLDLGERIPDKELASYTRYDEAEERLYLQTSAHDMVHGIYIAGADAALTALAQQQVPAQSPLSAERVLLYGNLQDASYYENHRDDIKRWLRVRPEFEADEYTRDNLCILNVRGGEYENKPELFLEKRYWTDAMAAMRQTRPDMEFMIVTDDEEGARKLLPGIECHHFSPEKDYVTVRNARYLVISNSSFAFFPAYTSETVQRVIAPKYWARHNVSDGYWASEQNIYEGFEYLGRDGRLYSPEQCRQELTVWRAKHDPAETKPWSEDDPAVARVRKRNENRRKMQKAMAKIERTLFRK